MKLQLDTIDIDPNNQHEHAFITWYDDNKHMTKQLVFLGYHIIKDGVCSFLRQEETNAVQEIECVKKRHADELTQERTKHSKILRETESAFEDTIKQMKDAMDIQHIRSLLEQEYTTKNELIALQKEKELESRFNTIIDNLKHEIAKYKSLNEELQNYGTEHETKLQLAVMKTQKDIEDRCNSQLLHISMESSKYKALYEEVKDKFESHIQNIVVNEKDKQIHELTQALQQQEKEVNMLKKTNFAKGNKGEHMILDLLRKTYPQHHYTDTSKEKHCGDIHMVSVEGDIVMFESKYKETITKQDVDKFYNDVCHLHDTNRNVTCSIFVSIITKNIPHIGEFKIDFCKGVPVMFIGFNNEKEFNQWFKNYVDMGIELASYHKHAQSGDEHIKDIIKKIAPLIEQVKYLKSSIDKLRNTYLSQVNNAVVDLEQNVKKLLDNIHNILSSDLNTGVTYSCHLCHTSFASKRALAGHMKIHKCDGV